jgi:hypothetical protein
MSKNKNWFIESTVEAGEVIINDGGSAVDFRIEGDTDPNLLVTDGSADKVGVGTNTPGTKLEVASETVGELIAAVNHNVSSIMPAEIVMKKGRGSKIAPATIVDGDELGQISFQGFDGSNYDELAHIKVASTSVSSDTSSMTFHADKFILDTGGLQFGSSGSNVTGIHSYAGGGSAVLDSNASDTDLVTAKQVYQSLTYAGITDISWSGGGVANHIPRANSATVLTSSNIFSAGASGNVAIGSDTTSSQSGKFKVTGNSDFIGTVTVGVNDTGHDVKFFGATSGKYMLWDESADTLQLGVDDTGVDFIAYGATTNKKMHWDESADTLLVHGGIELGYNQSDELLVKGIFKLKADDDVFKFYANSSSQASDIFQIYNESDIKSFWLEDTGETNIQSNLKFNAPTSQSIKAGSLALGVATGANTILNFDADSEGSRTFTLLQGGTARIQVAGGGNGTFTMPQIVMTSSNFIQMQTPTFRIYGATGTSTGGELHVSKMSTASGNLTIDSAGGTTTVDDNLTVTGNLNVTGAIDTAGTTSDTFMIDSDGLDLGFKTVAISDSSLPIAVNKWIHPIADAAGALGSAGIATQYIHSDDTMTISTKDDTDFIILAPGYNHDSGKVVIGTSTSKQSNLLCYGNADIKGNLSVDGTVSGTFSIDATTSADFQLDSAGTGPHLKVGSDDLIQTTTSDESTLNAIHTTGILLDSVAGGSSVLTLKSYNQEIQLTPGSNAAGERYVGITGSINVAQGGATTYNYISGAGTKIGAAANSNFAGTSDMSTGDTSIYMNNSSLNFDASADILNVSGASFVFGATNVSGAGATDNQEVKFYGNDTSAYVQWLQSSNKLLVLGTAVGTTNFQVQSGKAVFGRDGIDSTDVEFFGVAGEILNIDAGNSYCKFDQGIRKSPNVKAATVTLTQQESGRAIIIKNKSADAVYTLPAVAVGLNYKFMIVEKTGAYDIEIKSPSATNFFFGGVTHLDTDSGSGGDEIVTVVSDNDSNDFLTLTLVEAGSMVEMYCDGTNWFVTGHVASATAPAFGDASGL